MCEAAREPRGVQMCSNIGECSTTLPYFLQKSILAWYIQSRQDEMRKPCTLVRALVSSAISETNVRLTFLIHTVSIENMVTCARLSLKKKCSSQCKHPWVIKWSIRQYTPYTEAHSHTSAGKHTFQTSYYLLPYFLPQNLSAFKLKAVSRLDLIESHLLVGHGLNGGGSSKCFKAVAAQTFLTVSVQLQATDVGTWRMWSRGATAVVFLTSFMSSTQWQATAVSTWRVWSRDATAVVFPTSLMSSMQLQATSVRKGDCREA